MKTFVRNSVALSSSVLLSSVALAQSTSPAAPAASMAPVSSIIPYGLVVTYANLLDSTRQNTPDYFVYIARFGLKAKHGIAVGQIETHLYGNEPTVGGKHTLKTVSDADPATPDTYTLEPDVIEKNTIALRRADVGLNLAVGGMAVITPSFGRIRPGIVDAWGVDISYAPDGYSFMDGARLGADLDLGEGNKVSLGFTIGNALFHPTFLSNANAYAKGFGKSSKKEKAYVASIAANVGGVRGAFYYGAEAKQAVAGRRNPADTTKHDLATTEFADVAYMSGSLGYDFGAIGVGGWFQQDTTGDSVKATKYEGGALKFDGGPGKRTKTVNTKWAVGTNGDSTLFGVANLLETGDKLTYGASFGGSSARDSDSSNDSKEKENDVSQIAFGGGYSLGGFALELDYAFESTKAKSFADQGKSDAAGTALMKTSKHTAYLMGVYSF